MKTNPVARLAAVLSLSLAAAFALASCWQPPFDPALSASEYTAAKLGNPVWSKTVSIWSDEMEGAYYLPPKNIVDYGNGFFIKVQNSVLSARQVYIDVNGNATIGNNQFNDVTTFDSITLVMAASNPGFVYLAGNAASGLHRFDGVSTFSETHTDVIGYGSVPDQAGDDHLSILQWDFVTVDMYMGEFLVDGLEIYPPALTDPLPLTVANTLPYEAAGLCFVARNYAPNAYQSALYVSGPMKYGDTETFVWMDPMTTSMPVKLPISRQLTGILSDGRLLADTGDYLYVYEADGSGEFSIPTGALRFVHERYDGTKYISVFTRTVEIPQQDSDESEFLIQIWEIDTADLKDLAH